MSKLPLFPEPLRAEDMKDPDLGQVVALRDGCRPFCACTEVDPDNPDPEIHLWTCDSDNAVEVEASEVNRGDSEVSVGLYGATLFGMYPIETASQIEREVWVTVKVQGPDGYRPVHLTTGAARTLAAGLLHAADAVDLPGTDSALMRAADDRREAIAEGGSGWGRYVVAPRPSACRGSTDTRSVREP